MKKSAIFFTIFLFVLLIAVISERLEKKDMPEGVAMGVETTAQSVPLNSNLEIQN